MGYVIAQILCVLAALSMSYANYKKKKKDMLKLITLGSLFYCLQYLFISAYNGFYTNIANLLRNIIFYYKKKLKTNIVLYILALLYIIIALVSYDGILSLFPTIGSFIYLIILWQDNPKVIRVGNTLCYMFWFIYDLYVKLYLSAGIDFFSVIAGIIAIIKLNSIRKKVASKK